MHTRPTNLTELSDLLVHANIDLWATLIEQIQRIYQSAAPPNNDDGLMVLVKLPRQREQGGPIDSHEYWAFAMVPIRAVAIATGHYDAASANDQPVPLIVPQFNDDDGRKVPVEVLRPVQSLDRAAAKLVSGLDPDGSDPRIVLIGGGALGSQIHNHLSRMGWGYWTLVDNDTVLPHNVVRHRLGEHAVGFPKAPALQHMSEVDTPYNSIENAYSIDALSMSNIPSCRILVRLLTSFSTRRRPSRWRGFSVERSIATRGEDLLS